MAIDYQFGNTQLQPQQRRLLVSGKDSRISPRAFDLLLALLERRNRVVAKSELLDTVWPGLSARLAFRRGHSADAARMLGCVNKTFVASNTQRDPLEQKLHSTLERSVRDALQPVQLARLMREGEALSIENAVRLGLRE